MTTKLAEMAYLVNIPEALWDQAMQVTSQFFGPTLAVVNQEHGTVSVPVFMLEGSYPVAHVANRGPLGIRLWTHIQDYALLLEGFIEAQEG